MTDDRDEICREVSLEIIKELMANREKLKPCPFCGYAAKGEDWDGFVLICINCGTRGPNHESKQPSVDEMDELIPLWNDCYAWKELDKYRTALRECVEALESGVNCTCLGIGSMGYPDCEHHKVVKEARALIGGSDK